MDLHHSPTLSSALTDSSSKIKRVPSEYSAVHLEAQARLREDNPSFSRIAVGEETYTLLDFFQTAFFPPLLTVEGGDFSATTPDSEHELGVLWRSLLSAGARSVVLPNTSGSRLVQREIVRGFYSYLVQGTDVANAFQRSVLDARNSNVGLHEWAGMALVGSPFFSLS